MTDAALMAIRRRSGSAPKRRTSAVRQKGSAVQATHDAVVSASAPPARNRASAHRVIAALAAHSHARRGKLASRRLAAKQRARPTSAASGSAERAASSSPPDDDGTEASAPSPSAYEPNDADAPRRRASMHSLMSFKNVLTLAMCRCPLPSATYVFVPYRTPGERGCEGKFPSFLG